MRAGEGKRRWLCYNGVGCVSARAEEDHSVVEVAFHNTALHRKRVPLLTDFYHFSMAALSAQVARPSARRAHPSHVSSQCICCWWQGVTIKTCEK